MFLVLVIVLLKKLKIILQFNWFYYFLLLLSLIWVFIITVVVKYDSLYDKEDYFEGVVISKKIDGDKVSITFRAKEKLIGTYYLKSLEVHYNN